MISEEAWGNLKSDVQVCLWQCSECGFQYFPPDSAGSEAFYRELERPGYYCPDRPEFPHALDFAARLQLRRLLDLGCGSGAFLDAAKERGFEVAGLELNGAAAEKARARGHIVYDGAFTAVRDAHSQEGFDMVTMFQVLEHLSDPVRAVRDAVSLLRPGGCLAVSVPSSDGVNRLAPLSPYQWPPHHVSYWRFADLQRLGRVCGLEVVQLAGEPMLGSDILRLWTMQRQLEEALGRPPAGRSAAGVRLLSWLYRKSGLKRLFPNSGPSIYGYFRAPLRAV